MGLAILGVLVLAFIALAVLSAKTWQIWHVVLMFALLRCHVLLYGLRRGDA